MAETGHATPGCAEIAKMAEFSVDSKECPVCHMAAVVRNSSAVKIKGSTHHCEHCHTQLKVAVTCRVLWALPAMVTALEAYYLILQWIKLSTGIPGIVRAALAGGLGSLCLGITLGVARRAFVFRQTAVL